MDQTTTSVMRKCVVVMLVFFFCGITTSRAQLFLPVTDDPFGVPIRFNADSIRKLKIRSVLSAYQYKPDGRVIDDKGLREYFEFDQQGRQSFYWKTRVKGMEAKAVEHGAVYRRGRKIRDGWTEYKYEYSYDTVFIYTYYDSLSRISSRRACEGVYYHTWYYTYNEQGLIVTQIHCRETNMNVSHRDFRLGVQTVISREDFSYEVYSSTLLKQLCLNDEGKVYKETMMQYDNLGRLTSTREAYNAGGIRITNEYTYDSLGRMSTIAYSSNAGDQLTELTEYKYDSLGRIEAVRRYKNTVLKDEFSYLYDGTANMAYAYINRRHIELGIDIIKMQIEYY